MCHCFLSVLPGFREKNTAVLLLDKNHQVIVLVEVLPHLLLEVFRMEIVCIVKHYLQFILPDIVLMLIASSGFVAIKLLYCFCS